MNNQNISEYVRNHRSENIYTPHLEVLGKSNQRNNILNQQNQPIQESEYINKE